MCKIVYLRYKIFEYILICWKFKAAIRWEIVFIITQPYKFLLQKKKGKHVYLQNLRLKLFGDLADHRRKVFTTLFRNPGTGLSYGIAKTICRNSLFQMLLVTVVLIITKHLLRKRKSWIKINFTCLCVYPFRAFTCFFNTAIKVYRKHIFWSSFLPRISKS